MADTAVPAWHDARHQLPFVFAAGAAASSGALATVLVPEADAPRRLAVGGAVFELVAAEVLQRRLGDVGEAYDRGRARRAKQISQAATAGGAALLATVGRRRRVPQVAGALLVLVGAAAERFAVFEAGVESAVDPAFTVGPQRHRLADVAFRGAP